MQALQQALSSKKEAEQGSCKKHNETYSRRNPFYVCVIYNMFSYDMLH